MTTLVEVIQADREAAEKYGILQGWAPKDLKAMRKGLRDDSDIVQLVARTRIGVIILDVPTFGA